jgi:hypothetical protein
MMRELIRKVSGCIVLVVVLVASSPIRGETAPPTPEAAQGSGRDSMTLKLDPDTQKLVQPLADRRETQTAVATLRDAEMLLPHCIYVIYLVVLVLLGVWLAAALVVAIVWGILAGGQRVLIVGHQVKEEWMKNRKGKKVGTDGG